MSGRSWKRREACRRPVRMDEGFPEERHTVKQRRRRAQRFVLAPEPVVCERRRGTTPSHPEPGRETRQRRRYWRDARWESRSVRHAS